MPTQDFTEAFVFLKETISANGAIHRVAFDNVSEWMLVLQDGSRLDIPEGSDWVNTRAEGEREGKKFLYVQVGPDEWLDTLTEAERAALFTAEDASALSAPIDDDVDEEEPEKEPIDLDDIDDDGGDEDEEVDAQS